MLPYTDDPIIIDGGGNSGGSGGTGSGGTGTGGTGSGGTGGGTTDCTANPTGAGCPAVPPASTAPPGPQTLGDLLKLINATPANLGDGTLSVSNGAATSSSNSGKTMVILVLLAIGGFLAYRHYKK